VVSEKEDPNAAKFVPNVVHFDRSKQGSGSVQSLNDLVNYAKFLKPEEQFEVVIDDCAYDSAQSDVVDLSFALGSSYLNLKGLGRPERSAKVARFQEILEQIRESKVELPMSARSGVNTAALSN